MKGSYSVDINAINIDISDVFEYFKSFVKVKNLDAPLEIEELQNHKSKTSNLIFYLLSIEPSISLEVNKAIICYDMTKLMMLGPIARALFVILCFGVN